jgi:hypothetical protein
VKEYLKQREKLLTFHPSPTKLKSVMRRVARVRKRNTQQIFVKKPEENGTLGISRRQWGDNIKIYLIKLECKVTKQDLIFYIYLLSIYYLKLITDLWLSQKRSTS